MISLIATADAIKQLNESSGKSSEIELRAAIASEIVMRHIKLEEIPDAWITEDYPATINPSLVIDLGPNMDESPLPSPPTNRWAIVPGLIYAACVLVLGDLHQNREAGTSNPLSPTVVLLLSHYRKPTVGAGANIEDEE